jgi:hypothetical protein
MKVLFYPFAENHYQYLIDTMSKKADLTKRNTFLNKEPYFIQIYFYNVKIH